MQTETVILYIKYNFNKIYFSYHHGLRIKMFKKTVTLKL